MKVRLLNDGGYSVMESVSFPVEVEATFDDEISDRSAIYVHKSELLRVGFDMELSETRVKALYFVDGEFEVIE